ICVFNRHTKDGLCRRSWRVPWRRMSPRTPLVSRSGRRPEAGRPDDRSNSRRDAMAFLLTLAKPVTDEELLQISERNPGFQFERDPAGVLIVTPTGSEAGRREMALGGQLYAWAKRNDAGVTFGPSTGFRLPDGSIRSPDASWVRRDRWEALTQDEQTG